MSLRPPQQDRRRKLSSPASLQPPPAGGGGGGVGGGSGGTAARRRFSTVSGAVSRKLSTTIGWRTAALPTAEIVSQGKVLCGQYIRCRLKRSNLLSRKAALQRLRSTASLPVVRDVFPELLGLGLELERTHPSVYSGVGRQASTTPVLATDKAVASVLTGVARELSRPGCELTWAKVASLFAVAGGLAADCVRQGHPEMLPLVVDGMGQALDFHCADWIAHHGGWAGLLSYAKPEENDISLVGFAILLCAALLILLAIFFLLRWFALFF